MAAATESPPKGGFQFNDDQEYPPLTQKSDWGLEAALRLGNALAREDPHSRYQLMFGTVLLIHMFVRISEKLIFYLLNLEEWNIVSNKQKKIYKEKLQKKMLQKK